MTETPLRAELLLTHDVSAELERELTSGFRELGAPAVRVRRTVDHRGPAELQWLVLASLPCRPSSAGWEARPSRTATGRSRTSWGA